MKIFFYQYFIIIEIHFHTFLDVTIGILCGTVILFQKELPGNRPFAQKMVPLRTVQWK